MKLTVQILLALNECGNLLVSERQLRQELRITRTPLPTTVELDEAFRELDRHKLAIAIRDDLTGEIKWRISQPGRAALVDSGL